MSEAVESGNGNGWVSKAKVAATFINQVGLPSVIILFFLGAWGLVLAGKVDPPFVTRGQFKASVERNIEAHNAIIKSAEANTMAAEKTARVLEKINCDLKQPDAEKLKCFRDMNKGVE